MKSYIIRFSRTVFLFMLAAISVVGLFHSFSRPTFAINYNVPVSLPSFQVEIDTQVRENLFSKYPLIVYNDITYFPLTFHDCNILGLSVQWTPEDGLVIDKKEGYAGEMKDQSTDISNPERDYAALVPFPVRINGKQIDNTKEEYPVLFYRDITYIPWTWKFSQELGSIYRFDNIKGLRIRSHFFVSAFPRDAAAFDREKYGMYTYEGDQYYVEIDMMSMGLPWPNNMSVSKNGGQPYKLGDPDLFYGLLLCSSCMVDYDMELRYEAPWLFVYATNEQGTRHGLFKVHIVTGETVLVKAIPFTESEF